MTENKNESQEGLLIRWKIEADENGQKVITIRAVNGIMDEEEYTKSNIKPDEYTSSIFLKDTKKEKYGLNCYKVRTVSGGAYDTEYNEHDDTYTDSEEYIEKGDFTEEEAMAKVKKIIKEIKENRNKVREYEYYKGGTEVI